jgi:hypothetical protein
VKIIKFFDADPDPGILLTRDPGWKNSDQGSPDKYPGSATLFLVFESEGRQMKQCQIQYRYIGKKKNPSVFYFEKFYFVLCILKKYFYLYKSMVNFFLINFMTN